MADITREDVIDLLSDIKDGVDFETADNLIDASLLDSFDILSIVENVDDEFDIFIPAKDITPANFNSADKIYALLSRLADEE